MRRRVRYRVMQDFGQAWSFVCKTRFPVGACPAGPRHRYIGPSAFFQHPSHPAAVFAHCIAPSQFDGAPQRSCCFTAPSDEFVSRFETGSIHHSNGASACRVFKFLKLLWRKLWRNTTAPQSSTKASRSKEMDEMNCMPRVVTGEV